MDHRCFECTFLRDICSRLSILLTQSTPIRISKSSQRKSTISRLYASGRPAKNSLTPFKINDFLTMNIVQWIDTWTAAGVISLGLPFGFALGMYSVPYFSKLLLIFFTFDMPHLMVFAITIYGVLLRRSSLTMSCCDWDSLGGIAFNFKRDCGT